MIVAIVREEELKRMTRTAMAITSTVYRSLPPERLTNRRWKYIP